jgi:cytochrome c oxidase cbb3-type subunit 4
MEIYTLLREFADSWALLAMVLFFCGVILILFRPGAKKLHADAASIPLRDDRIDRGNDDEADKNSPNTTLKVEDAT